MWAGVAAECARRGEARAHGAGGCTPRVRGHVVAAGDVRRRRGRESCPRTRGLSPAGADRIWPRNVPVVVRKERGEGMLKLFSKNERGSLQPEQIFK